MEDCTMYQHLLFPLQEVARSDNPSISSLARHTARIQKLWTVIRAISFSDVAPTEPPQLPGNCPEPKKQKSWIPFRGHCYSFHSTVVDKWAHASVECLKMGMS